MTFSSTTKIKFIGRKRALDQLPDEFCSHFKHLTKRDVAKLRYVHSNFDYAVKTVLLRSIVVVTRDKDVYSFPPQWKDYTYTTSDAFFRMFRSQYFDPEFNKTLIFMGPLSDQVDYVERLKNALNDVQVYNAAPFSDHKVVSVTVNDDKGQPQTYWLVVEQDIFRTEFSRFGRPPIPALVIPSVPLQEIKILSLKIDFFNNKIDCRSIVLTGPNIGDSLAQFNYPQIEALSIWQQSTRFMTSFTMMAPLFTSLKEVGIVDSRDIQFQQFVLGLRSHSLTKLEIKCEIDGFGLEFDNILRHHSRSLETIVYHYKDNTPRAFLYEQPKVQHDVKAMPLGFRLLKLEDFPRLKDWCMMVGSIPWTGRAINQGWCICLIRI
ncbi:hypothetical protein Cantr_06854 [Candida viswanathii]|uniref:Uncharacterized protein n=1 Tax=Candida viswanathii TaxID=5486 RepID=A0A367XUM2_9ASCO|nr:hypothetical protein Cantr_06854 [Candida viswanathii]